MLNPQPAKIALIRSSSLPLRWLRSSLLSDFKCPKIGSIAERRLNHFHSLRLTLFFLRFVTCTVVPSIGSLPRYPLSQYASFGCQPAISSLLVLSRPSGYAHRRGCHGLRQSPKFLSLQQANQKNSADLGNLTLIERKKYYKSPLTPLY